MDFLNAIDLVKPEGFWSGIVFGLEGALKNYAWALILITVIIKLVMVPFDFINKYFFFPRLLLPVILKSYLPKSLRKSNKLPY